MKNELIKNRLGEGETMINNIELFTQSSIRIRGSFGTVCFDPFRMKEEPKDADYLNKKCD